MDPQANDYYLLLSAVINNCNPLSLVSSELITKQSCFSPIWPLKKEKSYFEIKIILNETSGEKVFNFP